MKLLHASDDPAFIGHLQVVLENEGIHTIIKNRFLSGAIGEIPPQECWQQLCLADDAEYEHAMRILAITLAPVTAKRDRWHCTCGEELEPQFMSCWQCGRDRPD